MMFPGEFVDGERRLIFAVPEMDAVGDDFSGSPAPQSAAIAAPFTSIRRSERTDATMMMQKHTVKTAKAKRFDFIGYPYQRR
jgi:hypothetical protein